MAIEQQFSIWVYIYLLASKIVWHDARHEDYNARDGYRYRNNQNGHKFQDMVKKLAEQNPSLKINLDESDKSIEAEVEAESPETNQQLCLSRFYSLLVKINSVNSGN